MKNNIGSFSLIKKINTALILNMIRAKGKVSRIELARESGLTAATITNITSELIDGGIIEETSMGNSTGGRKPVILKMCSCGIYVASSYISPHGVEFAVADLRGKIIFKKDFEFKNIPPSAEACTDFISDMVSDFLKKNEGRIVGISLGLHGVADSEKGVLINAPNLNWKNIPIKYMLQEKCNIDVYVQNDVRLMANAEMNYGIAKDYDDFVYFYIGSGVGAAVVSGGELLKGCNNAAGEIGHTVIDPDGPVCRCGKRGCLQAFVGEDAMLDKLAVNLHLSDKLNKESSCFDIMREYVKNSDEAAKKVVESEIKYLSVGISNIINIFDPELIVVGSDIEYFEQAVVEEISGQNKIETSTDIKCETVFSSLGKDAVILGGIAAVLKAVCDNPYELLLI